MARVADFLTKWKWQSALIGSALCIAGAVPLLVFAFQKDAHGELYFRSNPVRAYLFVGSGFVLAAVALILLVLGLGTRSDRRRAARGR